MESVLCQQCGAEWSVSGASHPVRCDKCGAAIAEPFVVGAGLGDDEVLAADLRDAFGLRVGAWRPGQASSGHASSMPSAFTTKFPLLAALAPQSRLGGFEIIDELGRGGMGVVYRARELSLDRIVALKVLPDLASSSGRMSRRFRNEAKAAARLNHTNVVPIYAQGEEGGRFYYAMKLVEGEPLDAVIKSHPEMLSSTHVSSALTFAPKEGTVERSEATALADAAASSTTTPAESKRTRYLRSKEDYTYLASLMAEVADGLAHAHDNGVLHRDIKPHNLIFGNDRHLYITDFGLAHLVGDPHITVAGEVMGTPSYISPEQARGGVGTIDARSDVFSLGVTLYELLTGVRPFEGETRDQILSAVCQEQPRNPRIIDPRIPVDLETICFRALEKTPADRYQTARALAEDLRRFSEGRPILAKRTPWGKRVAKWVRRHPAVSAATAAFVALVGVTIGWGVYAVSANRLEAAHHLDAAYDQLVRLSFHNPDAARPDVVRAEELGAEGMKLEFVRALLDLASFQQKEAAERVERLLDREPQDIQALYLLSWIQRRDRRFDLSRETRRFADEIGGPDTAEEYFLRGLAAHQTDPAIAIESYRMAIRLSAKSNQYFPQAGLHLARARNQQMYLERSLEPFDEARESLEELIRQEQYGGYPYYLLSITHQLAGEMYREGFAKGGEDAATQEFDIALDWARRGQEAAPDDDLPVTAEAAVLERQGRYEEALAARTRVLSMVTAEDRLCEAYHYRWRLSYWLGHYEDALADIERHASCVPESLTYHFLYPAIVNAELGDVPTARDYLNRLVLEHPGAADAIMLAVSGLRLLGLGEDADGLIRAQEDNVSFDDSTDNLHPFGWQETLWSFVAGESPLSALQDLAATSSSPRRTMGEAYFHAGAASLARGDRMEALSHFRRSYHAFDGAMGYTFRAEVILQKLESDVSWPPWTTTEPQSSSAWNERGNDVRERDGA